MIGKIILARLPIRLGAFVLAGVMLSLIHI